MKVLMILILGGFLGTISIHAQNVGSQAKQTSKGAAPPTTATAEPSTTDAAEYKIGPQDVLKIDVWKEDQLTRAVPVRPDGKITMPLLNDVQAAGMTPVELAAVIDRGERVSKQASVESIRPSVGKFLEEQ